jgi:glutaredoxin
MRPNQPNAVYRLIFALLVALSAGNALAVYKYVDANGNITYSDRPPPAGSRSVTPDTSGAGNAGSDLPYALRASVQRYPVTLYALTTACAPCQSARKYLVGRGIPFTEKAIRNVADAAALKKLNLPNEQFPVITIGAQVQSNFEPGALGALLDAAGYPKSSALPPGYKQAPAQAASAAAQAEATADDVDAKESSSSPAKGAAKAATNSKANTRAQRLGTKESAAAATVAPSTTTIRF